ncbi:MAG: TPM domain-containing protein [Candidatus Binatia bacterium]
MIFLLAALVTFILHSHSFAVELPPLQAGINDFAAIFPPASADDLNQRLHRFKTETATTIVVLTVKSLDGENLNSFTDQAFKALPFGDIESAKTALLVVARKERSVGLQVGVELRPLLPEPIAREKVESQVALYWDGLRSDLGIHGAVHYLFRVLRGDIRVGSQTETEKMQDSSLRGGAAGAIFAVCLGPFLAFFIGGLWGIYATHYGVQRTTRLLMGAIFGGATAKLVATLMSFLGDYGDNLWYFIMALAIPLAAFGSLTEFWMSGDWSGIPRDKGRQRKPEDKMGI